MDQSSKSLPNIVAEQIEADFIVKGARQPGDPLPPIRRMAKRYSVSPATVANALNILESKGMVTKRHGSGCHLAIKPEAPIRAPAGAIGFVIPTPKLEADIMMLVYEGVTRVCNEQGHHVYLAASGWSYEKERELVDSFVSHGCDGIILCPVPRPIEDLEDDYLRTEHRDFPIVLVDNAFPEMERSQIVFDHYQAGHEMTQGLLAEGHRHIAFVDVADRSGELGLKGHRDRLAGHLGVLRMRGAEPRESDQWQMPLLGKDFDDWARQRLTAWLTEADHASALILPSQRDAQAFIRIARDLDIRIPNQLRIVGFNLLTPGKLPDPAFPISTPDYVQAGAIAARMLGQEIAGAAHRSQVYVLPAPVLWPESTVTPPSPDVEDRQGRLL